MVDIKNAWNSLKTSSWGLFLAYIISVILSYLTIWGFIEPLDIPENLKSLTSIPHFITQRWFVHIASSFVIGAFLTLILDFAFRKYVTQLYKRAQAPIAAQTLQEYDEAFDDFTKQLAFAIGRYLEHKRSPEKSDENRVMDRVNEVRRARMRLLKVCGEQLRTLLIQNGTEWFNNTAAFINKAGDMETRVSAIAFQDRTSLEIAMRDNQPKQQPQQTV